MCVPVTGIEIVEGLPGSGKSFRGVREVLQSVLTEQRPCYTNLPLRWRAMREVVRSRGGRNAANLVRELTEGHFRAFMERQALRASEREGAMRFRSARGEVEGFESRHGPDVVVGPGANWIPLGSLVVIDEAHRWFPMTGASQDAGVLSYATMHRHHFHRVLLLTQNRMQISLAWRRNAGRFVQCRQLAADRLAWGLRWGHLGLNAFGYVTYSGDQIEKKSLENDVPLENSTVLPWWGPNRLLFRLYDSFTHAGSASQMRREVERFRRAEGVSCGEVVVKPRRYRLVGRVLRWVWRCVGLGVVMLVGVGLGSVLSKRGPLPPLGPGVASVEKAPLVAWPVWSGQLGESRVVVGGRVVSSGEVVSGVKIVAVRRGVMLVERGGRVYFWKFGVAEPRELGSVDDVRARAALASGRVGGGQ